MTCENCGYDSTLPIGMTLAPIKAGETGPMLLNDNGKKLLLHRDYCENQMKQFQAAHAALDIDIEKRRN